jgi:hypothetical protein
VLPALGMLLLKKMAFTWECLNKKGRVWALD